MRLRGRGPRRRRYAVRLLGAGLLLTLVGTTVSALSSDRGTLEIGESSISAGSAPAASRPARTGGEPVLVAPVARTQLADSFPEDVPLLEGEFVMSSRTDDVWNVMVRRPRGEGEVRRTAQAAAALLAEAGWTLPDDVGADGDDAAAALTFLADDDERRVLVTVTSDVRGVLVGWTVLPGAATSPDGDAPPAG